MLLALCWLAAPARALEVDIVDTASGRVLPTYRHAGKVYVAGEPGARYAIRVRNPVAARRLAVMSVDGVNVLTGETAAYGQRGYVFGPGEAGEINGWRKSLRETAAFYFTDLPDSYAARTGRAADVGVIGLAVFDEWSPPPVAVAPLPGAPARARARADEGKALADGHGSRAYESAEAQAAPKLGTGHGERLHSVVATTTFRRASNTPSEVIAIHYDRLASLIARGIAPAPTVAAPNPFPLQFVPDPGA